MAGVAVAVSAVKSRGPRTATVAITGPIVATAVLAGCRPTAAAVGFAAARPAVILSKLARFVTTRAMLTVATSGLGLAPLSEVARGSVLISGV